MGPRRRRTAEGPYADEIATARTTGGVVEEAAHVRLAPEMLRMLGGRVAALARRRSAYAREVRGATQDVVDAIRSGGAVRAVRARRIVTRGVLAYDYWTYADADTGVPLGCVRLLPSFAGPVVGSEQGATLVRADRDRVRDVLRMAQHSPLHVEVWRAVPHDGAPPVSMRARVGEHVIGAALDFTARTRLVVGAGVRVSAGGPL